MHIKLKSKITKFRNRLLGELSTEEYIKMGMKIGKNFKKMQGCMMDISHCFLIEIGDNVTFAPKVQLIAHDASTYNDLGYTKIGKITIGNNVFIGANSTVLPNVSIGNDVIIGAGSVVTKNIPDNSVAAGNPAKVITTKSEYLHKNAELMKTSPLFDENWTMRKNITDNQKQIMKNKLGNGIGFVQ